MRVTKLVGTCDRSDCPTLYSTDRGTFLVQGAVTADHGLTIPEGESVVEIPAELLRKAVRDQLI
ncbi:hypothetical protein ACWD4J_37105 [Streptomyces sp. NPDC002577]